MKRFDAVLLKVFLYGLPFGVVFAAFGCFYSQGLVDRGSALVGLVNNVSGLFIAAWMAISLYLCFRLTVSETMREQVISRITFMRERDERESVLTGKAIRTTFLITLAVLIFLFFLSCIQVSVYRVPPEQAVDGKTGMITLGVGFRLFEADKSDRAAGALQREDIFTYRGLPVSSEAVILMLILLQIVSYNYSMRRFLR
jgi:hypothetical protein